MAYRSRAAALLVAALLAIHLPAPRDAAGAFASPAFQAQWQQSEAIAPNFWGPLATARDGRQEPSQGQGARLVQYFDKGRMQLGANGAVTSGSLAADLVRGQIETGDATFPPMPPPDIPIAGDPDNPGPTYAQLSAKGQELFDPAPRQTGGFPRLAASASGDLSMGDAPASGPATFAAYDDPTRHNVPKAFAEYRERAGPLTIGLAIAEPFSATVRVGGAPARVLVQVFEGRVLTYTASNPVAFRVEMGNVGQHYYRWRYGDAGAPPPSAPIPRAPIPPTPAAAPLAPSPSASGGTSFAGAGAAMTRPFPLKAGLVLFRATARGGSGAFLAELRDERGNFIDLAASETGPSTSSRLATAPSDGMYLLAVQYDGPWSIAVENPGDALDNPIGAPTTLAGSGTTVTRALSLSSGLLLVTYTSKGRGNFVAELYDASGQFVDLGADDLANKADTRAIPIPSAGIYIFGVVFDGEWTLALAPG